MEISEALVRCRLKKLDEATRIVNMGEYYTKSYEGHVGEVNINNACFGSAISNFSNAGKDTIVVTEVRVNRHGPKYGEMPGIAYVLRPTETLNNFVLFNDEQLVNYMEYLKKKDGLALDFDMELKKDHVVIKVNKSIITRAAQFRFILFWLRQTYKYPFNLFLIDAIKLQKRHPEIELYNLLTIPHYVFTNIYYTLNFPVDSGFKSEKEVREGLGMHSYVNDVLSEYNMYSDMHNWHLNTKKYHPSNYAVWKGNGALQSCALEFYKNEERFDDYERILEKKLEFWHKYHK